MLPRFESILFPAQGKISLGTDSTFSAPLVMQPALRYPLARAACLNCEGMGFFASGKIRFQQKTNTFGSSRRAACPKVLLNPGCMCLSCEYIYIYICEICCTWQIGVCRKEKYFRALSSHSLPQGTQYLGLGMSQMRMSWHDALH